VRENHTGKALCLDWAQNSNKKIISSNSSSSNSSDYDENKNIDNNNKNNNNNGENSYKVISGGSDCTLISSNLY
jgi:hypothetical protein